MALRKRKWEQQDTFCVTTDKLGNGPRNAFYDRLNQLFAEVDFDGKLEKAAEPCWFSGNWTSTDGLKRSLMASFAS